MWFCKRGSVGGSPAPTKKGEVMEPKIKCCEDCKWIKLTWFGTVGELAAICSFPDAAIRSDRIPYIEYERGDNGTCGSEGRNWEEINA
jgi:hypothetical protein